MPELHETWDKLKAAEFISVTDLQSGYWQLALSPKSRHKTAFKCEFGTFHYNVVPMGIEMGMVSSAAYFQRHLENLLRRHGILCSKVHVSSDKTETYIVSL